MRRITTLVLIAALLALPAFASAGDLPDIDKSAVTIPWSDFKALIEKMQGLTPPPPPPPPVEYALGRGTLTGKLESGRLEITATYPLSILADGWVMCPLVYTGSPVADVQLDGKPAPVTASGGEISLVVKGPAQHTLTVRFEVQAPMLPGPGTVGLTLPEGAGQVLTLMVGEKLSGVTVDGAVTRDIAGGVSAVLTGNSLSVHYNVALEKQEAAEEKLPPKVVVENSTLVSVDEGFIRAVVQLDYEVRHAPVTVFKLQAPEGFEVVDASGPSIAGWKVDPATRELAVTIGYEVKGAYQLTVVLERSMEGEDFTFALPSLAAKDVEHERGSFAVQVTGGVEVTPTTVKDLQPVDAKELPPGLAGGATNPIVLSYKYLRQPFAGELRVVRHKTQAVLGAAIDDANYIVQLTEDGDLVAGATYTVRNNRQQFLEIRLPGGDKTALWSSFVAGKPVKPSQTKDGAILLPLEKSSYTGGDISSFTVEVIYYAQIPSRMRFVGLVDLELPKVDLPISRSSLTVFAPQRFGYERVGGSMREREAVPVSTVSLLTPTEETGVADEMMMAGEAAPAAPMAKSEGYAAGGKLGGVLSRGAGLSSGSYDYERDERQKQAEENFQNRLRAAQSAQDAGGALPTKFAIPQAGSSMRYQELITIGEASTLKLLYLHAKAKRYWRGLWKLIGLLAGAALAYYAQGILTDEDRRRGRRRFILAGAGIIVAAWFAGSADHVILGAGIGLAGRFVRWVVAQIRLSQARHAK